MRRLKIAALLAPLALVQAAPVQAQSAAPAEGPSFSCAAAGTAVERAICASPDLAREDRVMAQLYPLVLADRRAKGLSSEAAPQLVWLAERKDCEKPDARVYKSREECLLSRYRSRNAELAVDALFLAPELATGTLQRLDPGNAPYAQALVLYAQAPQGSAWNSPALAARRREIEAVLAQPFVAFMAGENTVYGKSILEEGGKITLARAFGSDESFAQLIGIMATYSDGETIPPEFPCEVLLRNPGLTEVTGPFFGSTLDNFTLVSTCHAQAPKLETMRSALLKTWPNCEGTIRFMAFRAYSNELTAAVLGQPRTARLSRKPFPRRTGVSAAMVNAVIAELTAYYQTYRAMDAGTARATAQERVRAILTSAHDCGGGGE